MSMKQRIFPRLGFHVFILAAANVLQAVLAMAQLPLATRVLTAADFGIYALVMSIVGLAVAISDGGGGLSLPAHYGPADRVNRSRMVATFLTVSIAIGAVVGGVFLVAWPWRGVLSPELMQGLGYPVAITCAALIPLRATAGCATVIFAVSGRGPMIAAQLAAQACTAFAATIFALFALRLGVLSLFVGALIGQLASVSVAAVVLRTEAVHLPSRQWLKVAAANAPTAALAALSDGVRAFVENALIVQKSDMQALGYYSHARMYYGMALIATNSVSQNLWSISLDEAHNSERRFIRTGRAWEGVHLAVFLCGLGVVALGRPIVGLLTNHVLTPAADYLPWFMVVLLVHSSGRAALATLYAAGQAAQVTRARVFISAGVIASLPFVMSTFMGIGLDLGVPGLLGAAFVDALLYRLYLRWRAEALGRLPFQDFWVVAGVLGISVSAAASAWLDMDVGLRFSLFLTLTGVALFFDWARGGVMRELANIRFGEA
jgi:O-antigen/teichoic acid export membrane protein